MPLKKIIFSIASLIYLTILAACIYRIFFGVSVEDEVLYIALADLPRIGGKWFVNDFTIQTTSSIVFSPLIHAYTSFFGTQGIVLFSRFLYLALSLVTSFLSFFVFKKFSDRSVALLFASLPILFVGHGISSLYYNGLGSHLFMIISMLSFLYLHKPQRRIAVLIGALMSLASFSYPTLPVIFIFTALFTLWMSPQPKRYFKDLFIGALPVAALLTALLFNLGIDNILNAIELSKPLNHPGAWWKIPRAWEMIKIYYGPAGLALVVCLTVFIALEFLKPKWSYLAVLGYLASYLIWGGVFEGSPVQVLWFSLQFFILIRLLFYKIHPWERLEFKALLVIAIPAMLGSLVTLMTSLQILYNTYITGFLGAVIAIILIARQQRLAGWLLSLTLIAGTGFWYFTAVYEDDNFSKLHYTIHQGPFAQLKTGQRKGLVLDTLFQDLQRLENQGSILFKDQFPGGYLMSQRRPAGPTINILPPYMFPQARPLYTQLFSRAENLPDIVVEFIAFPTKENLDWFYMHPTDNLYNEDFHNFFMKTGLYRIILDRGTYRFLERIKP